MTRSRSGFHRFLLIGLSAAAVLQGAWLLSKRVDRQEGAPRPYAKGQVLPRMTFRKALGSPWERLRRPHLDGLIQGCALLIFFRSTCPACERLAPEWGGQPVVQIADVVLPVFWIGAADDSGAQAWLERHSLRNGLLARERTWRQDLRVSYVPQYYILAPGRLLVGIGGGELTRPEALTTRGDPMLKEVCRRPTPAPEGP